MVAAAHRRPDMDAFSVGDLVLVWDDRVHLQVGKPKMGMFGCHGIVKRVHRPRRAKRYYEVKTLEGWRKGWHINLREKGLRHTPNWRPD